MPKTLVAQYQEIVHGPWSKFCPNENKCIFYSSIIFVHFINLVYDTAVMPYVFEGTFNTTDEVAVFMKFESGKSRFYNW